VFFITNTDIQQYVGENQLSIVSQMVGLTFAMFVAANSRIYYVLVFDYNTILYDIGVSGSNVLLICMLVTLGHCK
jgi:potassium-transporting ATPase potassium-binding subunit